MLKDELCVCHRDCCYTAYTGLKRMKGVILTLKLFFVSVSDFSVVIIYLLINSISDVLI